MIEIYSYAGYHYETEWEQDLQASREGRLTFETNGFGKPTLNKLNAIIFSNDDLNSEQIPHFEFSRSCYLLTTF